MERGEGKGRRLQGREGGRRDNHTLGLHRGSRRPASSCAWSLRLEGREGKGGEWQGQWHRT